MLASGIMEAFGNMPDVELIKTFEDSVDREEIIEHRR